MVAIVWVPECSNDGNYWHNGGSVLLVVFWWQWKHLVVVVEMFVGAGAGAGSATADNDMTFMLAITSSQESLPTCIRRRCTAFEL